MLCIHKYIFLRSLWHSFPKILLISICIIPVTFLQKESSKASDLKFQSLIRQALAPTEEEGRIIIALVTSSVCHIFTTSAYTLGGKSTTVPSFLYGNSVAHTEL